MLNFPDAPSTNQTFVSGSKTWVWDGVKWVPSTLSDALSNGTTYGRLNAAWTGVLPLTGGTLTGSLAVAAQNVTIGTATQTFPSLVLNGIAGTPRQVVSQTAGKTRWVALLGDTAAEGVSNAGSDFAVYRYADDGSTYLGNPLAISRATGIVTLAQNLGLGAVTPPSDALLGSLRIGPNMVQGEASPGPNLQLASNAYETTVGTTWKYLTTGTASVASLRGDGTWGWYNAVSGSAGATVPWVSRMALDATGALTVTGAGSFSGNSLTVNASGSNYATLNLSAPVTSTMACNVVGLRNGVQRWQMQMPNAVAETGTGNAGGDFGLYCYSDTGTYIGNPLSIIRATGNASFAYTLSVGGTFVCSGGVCGLGAANSTGYCYLTRGDATNPGYLALYNPSGTRVGYVGWQVAGPRLMLANEGGYIGWQVGGDLQVSSNVTASGGLYSYKNAATGGGVASWSNGWIAGFVVTNTGVINFCNIDGTGYITGGARMQLDATNCLIVTNAVFTNGAIYPSNGYTGNSFYLSADASNNYLSFATTAYYFAYNRNNGILSYHATATGDKKTSFDTAGNLYIETAGAYKTGGGAWIDPLSDARAKDVLGPYQPGLEQVLQLRPIRYRVTERYGGHAPPLLPGVDPHAAGHEPPPTLCDMRSDIEAGTEFAGLIAQEVEGVMPEMVRRTAGLLDGERVDDLRTLDTSALTWAFLNAFREVDARLRALEAR